MTSTIRYEPIQQRCPGSGRVLRVVRSGEVQCACGRLLPTDWNGKVPLHYVTLWQRVGGAS